MKKLLCVLLISMLCFTQLNVLSESGMGVFNGILIDNTIMSSKEWVKTGDNRALITSIIFLELYFELGDVFYDEFETALVQPSYVGLSDGAVLIHYHGLSYDMMVVYRPNNDEILYGMVDPISDDVAVGALSAICSDGPYENDIDDLITAMASVYGLLIS